MAKQIDQVSLLDIAPPSITGDSNIRHIITSLDPQLWSVSRDIREAFLFSRLDELPEEVLDLLAWQWHVDFYELAKSLEAKRDMVKKSISWHRKKGTTQAILDALAMLGVEAKFTSWQHEGAQPYTFAIDAKLTGDFWQRVDWTKPTLTIRRAIQESKAARSWMSKLYVYMETEGSNAFEVGTAVVQGKHQALLFRPQTYSADVMPLTVGTATGQIHLQHIPIVQGRLADESLTLSSGTLTAQGKFHSLPISQAEGASSLQAFSVWTGTGQKLFYGIPLDQATSSEGQSGQKAGTLTAQGIHQAIGLSPPKAGHSTLEAAIATSISQTHTYPLPIEQGAATDTQTNLSAGCILSRGIHIQLNMAA